MIFHKGQLVTCLCEFYGGTLKRDCVVKRGWLYFLEHRGWEKILLVGYNLNKLRQVTEEGGHMRGEIQSKRSINCFTVSSDGLIFTMTRKGEIERVSLSETQIALKLMPAENKEYSGDWFDSMVHHQKYLICTEVGKTTKTYHFLLSVPLTPLSRVTVELSGTSN